MENMNESAKMYFFLKVLVIVILVYLFFNPELFAMGGYNSASDGIVICRGFSLLLGIYTFSEIINTIIKK